MGAVLALIARLYAIEKIARERELRGEERRILREQGARPVLGQLHDYLLRIRAELLPKSVAGQAAAYALNHWTALTRYCENGDLEIDNNAAERSLRGIAVGRNNWTFFGSDNGGKTAAVLRTFVASCERVKIDPCVWFRDVLTRIASYPVNQLDQLLPHNWARATSQRKPARNWTDQIPHQPYYPAVRGRWPEGFIGRLQYNCLSKAVFVGGSAATRPFDLRRRGGLECEEIPLLGRGSQLVRQGSAKILLLQVV